eukprot:8589830-Pyramimonas_sp.AAC.1
MCCRRRADRAERWSSGSSTSWDAPGSVRGLRRRANVAPASDPGRRVWTRLERVTKWMVFLYAV